MPIIKRAIKKVRQDEKKTRHNQAIKTNLKTIIAKAKKEKTVQELTHAYSALDKAAKNHLIHKNAASRLKSRLSKGVVETPKETVKKTAAVKNSSKKRAKVK